MPKYRVYMNGFHEPPFFWSVDEGSIATERKVHDVLLTKITSHTCVDLSADNIAEPKAWLEVTANSLQIANGVAILRG